MIAMRTGVSLPQATIPKHTQPQKGNVLVEFALILPLFLFLLFGMITFSVALYNKTVLTMATREGARAGAKFVANRTDAIITSNATAAASQVYQNNLISFGSGMTPSVTSSIQNNILTVTANVNYTGIYIFSNFTISAQSSMRLE